MDFKKIFFLIIAFSLLPLFLHAQKNREDNPLRTEFQVEEDEKPLDIANCNEYGSVVFFASSSTDKDTLLWSFYHYDVNFALVRDAKILLPGDIYFRKTSVKDSILFAAFSAVDKRSKIKLVVVRYNLLSANCSYISYENSDYQQFSSISVTNNIALVSFLTRKNLGKVISLDFNSGEIKEVIKSDENDNTIERFDILNVTDNFLKEGLLIFSIKNINKSHDQILSVHNFSNNKLTELFVKTLYDSIMPVTASPIYSYSGQLTSIVGGYYSGDLKKIHGDLNIATKTSGVYSYDILTEKIQSFPINLTNNDIYFYWKDIVRFDSIINYKSKGYILSGEALAPIYRTISDVDYDYWGRPYSTQRIVLDGFATFRNIDYVFTPTGSLAWISFFDISDAISSHPMERVCTSIVDNEIVDVAFAKNRIIYKASNIETKKNAPDDFYVSNKYRKDVIMEERNSRIEPWYDNYYLVYGYQTVKNNSLTGLNKRTVFFMQKVGIEK